MKKLFFISWFIVCITAATGLLHSQTDDSVEKLVHIMVSGDTTKDLPSSLLMGRRNPNDYQDVYDLVIKNPTLLKGIIHDGQTLAMLCVKRGYPDLLERLIVEEHPVDLATPCNLIDPDEPQTTVLHALLGQYWTVSGFLSSSYSEEYIELIKRLTKLILNKYPQLLDVRIDRNRTARQQAFFWGLGYLIPSDLPQDEVGSDIPKVNMEKLNKENA